MGLQLVTKECDIPMFLSSWLVAMVWPEITSSVAKLMPAYSFG